MNVFHTHARIVEDYATYIRSFLNIADPAIRAVVEGELEKGKLWPEPLLQFNPAFEMAGSMANLSRDGILHRDLADIFKGYSLYRHQVEAIELGTARKDFVVTSGTGSGKSLTYIGSIFHHLLSNPGSPGVSAVVVYPMNALINSQSEEFNRYKNNYEAGTREFPITFGQYTGQEKEDARQGMREKPPQVLLTNYMMLELLLTRIRERSLRDAIFENLRFLVFDELHTYRGRQGADVAMLIRRISVTLNNVLGVQVTRDRKGYRVVTGNLPPPLRELLPAGDPINVSFQSPTPEGYHYIGRNHRFVEQLCQLVMANTLARVDKRAARAAIVRTRQVTTKTTLLLFRCRNVIEQAKAGHKIVAGEMLLWGWRGTPQQKEFLDHAEAKKLLSEARASSDLSLQSRAGFLENELKLLASLRAEFDGVAERQSKRLVEAHERFSALMDRQRFQVVYPVLPMDLLDVYVLLPE